MVSYIANILGYDGLVSYIANILGYDGFVSYMANNKVEASEVRKYHGGKLILKRFCA
ncbi:hypothetical protein VCR15J2_470041 [Vibrio coralliirubri]|nr:hypothetical protein VCR15J2_470041 [Vibrio coralliirubri]